MSRHSEEGARSVEKVRDYLESMAREGVRIPEERGRISVTTIAAACGFARSVPYQNAEVKRLLNEAAAKAGIGGIAEKDVEGKGKVAAVQATVSQRDRRISELEQKLAARETEIIEVRKKLATAEQKVRLLEAREQSFLEGKRIIP